MSKTAIYSFVSYAAMPAQQLGDRHVFGPRQKALLLCRLQSKGAQVGTTRKKCG